LRRAATALGLRLAVGPRLATVERTLTHRRLRLTAYRCRARAAPPASPGLRFAAPSEVGRLGLATAMRRLLEAAGS
jgi:hypothetical protein